MELEINAYSDITKEYLLEVKSKETKLLFDIGFDAENLSDDDYDRLHELLDDEDEHHAIFYASGDFRINEIAKCIKSKIPSFFAKTKKTKADKKKQPTRYYFSSGEKLVFGDITVTPVIEKSNGRKKCVFILNYDSDEPIIVCESEINKYVKRDSYLKNFQTI